MVLPDNEKDMSDAELKRWLIKEGEYSAEGAQYVINVLRGKVHAEDLD